MTSIKLQLKANIKRLKDGCLLDIKGMVDNEVNRRMQNDKNNNYKKGV